MLAFLLTLLTACSTNESFTCTCSASAYDTGFYAVATESYTSCSASQTEAQDDANTQCDDEYGVGVCDGCLCTDDGKGC